MRQKVPPKVITLAATKGGVGKTTLASVLAVRASQDSGSVALIDSDPQSSLHRWWELRGRPDNPKIFELDAVPEALGLMMVEGREWLIIDTPPALYDRIEAAVYLSDFVLIPTRASALDVEAVDDVVDLCKEHGKPFAFVLNAVLPGWGKLNDEADKYLSRHGAVLSVRVAHRKAYVSAMTAGKSGPEVERDGQCRKEIDALWAVLKRQSAKMVR